MKTFKLTSYPSDLSNHTWDIIKDFIPKARREGRPRENSYENILNAILYVLHTGCQWRSLPSDFPKWQTVYFYFSKWTSLNIWDKISQFLVRKNRRKLGKKSTPSTVIIDGQSVKAAWGEERGWDGFKKLKGRKRQIIVDTLGYIWTINIHRANLQESTKTIETLQKYPKNIKKPKRILGDHGYKTKVIKECVKKMWKAQLVIVDAVHIHIKNDKGWKRKKMIQSNLKPQRWVVERTFGWFNFYRRLSKDYEKKICISEAFIFLCQISLLLKNHFA